MDIKNNKYKYKEEVSFERRNLFKSSFVRGTIISYKFVNYNWVYLVECADDKKLLTIPEDDIWSLEIE
ncbi:hypothetical protein [Pelosinus sp. sgz500959]|uniref:hypothetical protein n=1 Tax=Pelosinus sp. sgz500959 TaxID=3242472 RepID=UPI00367341F4